MTESQKLNIFVDQQIFEQVEARIKALNSDLMLSPKDCSSYFLDENLDEKTNSKYEVVILPGAWFEDNTKSLSVRM